MKKIQRKKVQVRDQEEKKKASQASSQQEHAPNILHEEDEDLLFGV